MRSQIDEFYLDPRRATALFMILQEALTNVLQHAHATRATVTVRRSTGSLIVSVADNGRGIADRDLANPGSLGIIGMRERSAILGGTVTLGRRRATRHGRDGDGPVASRTRQPARAIMIRVIIADDHPVVRHGIRQIVSSAGDMIVVDEATDGRELLDRARTIDHDLVILDLSMPATDGLEVLKELKRERPRVPVVILTMYSEDQFAIRALKAGAAGYLMKETRTRRVGQRHPEGRRRRSVPDPARSRETCRSSGGRRRRTAARGTVRS